MTRPIRVAVVIPTHWDYRMGGAQYQAKLLVERIDSKHRAKVAWFAARARGLSFPDHEVRALDERPALRRYGHFWDYWRLQRKLGEFDPDVIYQRVACAYTGIACRYASRARIPLVWHVANTNDVRPPPPVGGLLARPHRLIESRLAKLGARAADRVVVQTNDQAALLQRHFNRQADHVIANFHPAAPESEKPPGLPISVVWIANFKLAKRPELFIELAERLKRDGRFRFTMVGMPHADAAAQADLDRRISAVGNIDYRGAMSQTEVEALLQSAHVLVNTSTWEGFSNTFIQAWMRGVAVMTIGVNPDGLLDDGFLGRCCDSVDELANSLGACATDPDMLNRAEADRRAFAADKFSMRNADRLSEIILSAGEKSLEDRIQRQQK